MVSRVGALQFIQGKMTADERYIKILKENLRQSAAKLDSIRDLVQLYQDNDPIA